jgi:hypothetical protein
VGTRTDIVITKAAVMDPVVDRSVVDADVEPSAFAGNYRDEKAHEQRQQRDLDPAPPC